ncbi:chromate transporter [Anaerococcus sp. ENR1011]|uniref:Chromate transporter n=1 Tax=Anaerococcus groningensis TaxID=3115616 RepID=A0ABW9N021_9FIRM
MLRLIWEFFKTGIFAIGGGMATIPFLQEMAKAFGWFSEEDLLDMIAVSESTPGAIGINLSTFAGFKSYGVGGAILATLALITGPIIITLIIARAMAKFKSSKVVHDMFETIRPATAGLILGAMSSVIALTLFNIPLFKQSGNLFDLIRVLPLTFFGIYLFVLIRFKKVHPLAIICVSALVGVIFSL